MELIRFSKRMKTLRVFKIIDNRKRRRSNMAQTYGVSKTRRSVCFHRYQSKRDVLRRWFEDYLPSNPVIYESSKEKLIAKAAFETGATPALAEAILGLCEKVGMVKIIRPTEPPQNGAEAR